MTYVYVKALDINNNYVEVTLLSDMVWHNAIPPQIFIDEADKAFRPSQWTITSSHRMRPEPVLDHLFERYNIASSPHEYTYVLRASLWAWDIGKRKQLSLV